MIYKTELAKRFIIKDNFISAIYGSFILSFTTSDHAKFKRSSAGRRSAGQNLVLLEPFHSLHIHLGKRHGSRARTYDDHLSQRGARRP